MEKRWVLKDKPEKDVVQEVSSAINVSPALAAILAQRHIATYDQARSFFRPSLKQLPSPFLMKDMDHAVNRLVLAMKRSEKILVYGDYDVDGTTSVALVYGFLRQIYPFLDFYIPDRYSEGYGISEKGIQYAVEQDCSLVIALDCGIRAVNLINKARKQGIDFIVCDHHRPGDQLPPAHAILNPKQEGCPYPYKELCGCGVGFKLLQGFCQQINKHSTELHEQLDLLAIAIAADIVPITGENRILTHFGLKKLNESPRPGLKALAHMAGLHGEITVENVVFGFAPRINAAGRMQHARAAVELLLAENEETALQLADGLNLHNAQRKNFDSSITQQALDMIEQDELLKNAKSTVLFKNDWHKGVVGIVASRCIEKYYRPTIILTESNQKATGSARSVNGFDVYEAIAACADLLEQFGGHTHAAGLTLSIENVPFFQKKFEEVVSGRITEELLVPQIEIDLEVNLSEVTKKFYKVIQQMGPFGPGNMRPVFISKDLYVSEEPQVLKEKHLKFYVKQADSSAELCAVGFGMASFYDMLRQRIPFKMAYNIEENNFNGHSSLQLMIRDIKPMA